MGYASKSGKARVSSSSPQAFAICDRCGALYNHVDLSFQHDWRGATMKNLNILVCNSCLDKPQEQLLTMILSADPVPVKNPRIQDYNAAEVDYRTLSGEDTIDKRTGIPIPGKTRRLDQNGNPRIQQSVGKTSGSPFNPGLDPNASMPLWNKKHYNVVIPIASMISDGSSIITVTSQSAHGLKTNDQVIILGSSLSINDGFYSVNVINDFTFTYNAQIAFTLGTILQTPNTIIKTTIVGLPRGESTIPQTGL